jgi:HK97 gp10 family phage protein
VTTKPFEITGFAKLDTKLAGMSTTMRKKPLRVATRAVAKLTLRQAKLEAPHDTGALEASLKVKSAKRSRRLKNMVMVNVETKDGPAQGDQFYGHMLEFGTKFRSTKEGWNRGAIPKNTYSFLRPALYSFVERKRRIFVVNVQRWIREQDKATRNPNTG